jgi:hypothetical protein
MQARWPKDRVDLTGRHTEYVRISDAGEERTFRFCPDCGATVFWTSESRLDSIAVPIGAFAWSSSALATPAAMISIWHSVIASRSMLSSSGGAVTAGRRPSKRRSKPSAKCRSSSLDRCAALSWSARSGRASIANL